MEDEVETGKLEGRGGGMTLDRQPQVRLYTPCGASLRQLFPGRHKPQIVPSLDQVFGLGFCRAGLGVAQTRQMHRCRRFDFGGAMLSDEGLA